jgi:hypothetical protein
VSTVTASAMFFAHAILDGLTLSVIVGGEAGDEGATFGALILYLDVINLFLLRLLGRRK